MDRKINFSLSSFIRTIPVYPKVGTNFYDVTTLLCNAEAFGSAVDGIVDYVKELDFDLIVAIEARSPIDTKTLQSRRIKNLEVERQG